ncbi:MAG: LexA family transcriptional regulator [Bacteroidia bacterium]|nr:LexA family transcriptional regulator [Bacteroidia bacterium]
MDLAIEAQRFKEVRESLELTQSAFAKILGIGNTTADIERGRTKLPGHVVMKLMRNYHINPLWLFGQSKLKKINARDISPKVISIDNVGQENILLVNEKAAAGYAGNLGDPVYYEKLPSFTFPTPEYRNATFRGFQIEGNSMTPIANPNDWIIAKALESFDEIKNEGLYIIVEKDGIRFKKVLKNDKLQTLILISTNPDYDTDQVQYTDIQEIWEFHSKISNSIAYHPDRTHLSAIYHELTSIKAALVNSH